MPGAADARGGAVRRKPAQMGDDPGARSRRAASARSGRAELQRSGAESLVGRRYQLHSEPGPAFSIWPLVLDAFGRKIVGWAMETYLRTELVLKALNVALGQRRPAGVIHHSDQGSQYTSLAFGKRCDAAGARPSMGSLGDCFDKAMCESFFATLECELLDHKSFKTQGEARMAVFDFIEGWYNPHRCHSALDYSSPIDYERSHSAEAVTAAQHRPPNRGNAGERVRWQDSQSPVRCA
jgi:transposase InsO family protein